MCTYEDFIFSVWPKPESLNSKMSHARELESANLKDLIKLVPVDVINEKDKNSVWFNMIHTVT